MAIIKSGFPGIEVVVLINSQKAQEYQNTANLSDDQVARFITSIDDAEFCIRLLVTDDYKFHPGVHDALGIKVLIDGEYRCSTVWKMDQPVEYMYMRGSRVKKADGGSSVMAFKFTAIKTVDGKGEDLVQERELIAKQKEDTKATGEIAVFISRLKIKEKKMGLVGDGGKTTENQHSVLLLKANIARKLTHGTGFGDEVGSSKHAIRYTATPIDGLNSPIATFCFMYRAKDVLDELRVTPISEELPLPGRKDSGMFVEQDNVETPKKIKNESNDTDKNATDDIYGATPQRQTQPPAEAALPASFGNMVVFQNLLMSLGLTEEQKQILAQQLLGGVSNTAQNLQTPRPNSQPVASVVPEVAKDSGRIKQERGEVTDGTRGMSITILRRTSYQERQTDNGGFEIDLTTPIRETFIKPGPDANVQAAKDAEDTVMVEQDASISSAAVQSAINDAITITVAPEFPNLEATQAAVRAAIEKNHKARQGSMSPVDGIATPKTPDTPVQEPVFERADESQVHNADVMQVEKPTVSKELSFNSDADIIASIEVDASSIAETVRRRKDSILSDASMDSSTELQRTRSGHPTITTVHSVGEVCSAALSPTPQPAENLDVATREATEGIPVETIDIDMTTGRDIREHTVEDDSHSPSRRLTCNYDSDGDYEFIYSPIKGEGNTIIGTPLLAAIAAEKPSEGFKAALTAGTAQASSNPTQTAEAAATALTSERPVMSFEEAMARAKSKKTIQPVITANVEVPATPTAAPEDITLPASEVHTGDHGFIDVESVVAAPETPVKHTTPHGLTKNDVITNPSTSKGTPNTLDRRLSASRKDMADMDSNVNTLRKRLYGNKDRTPSSKSSEDKVGTPVTGNAGSATKKTTPIKRERDGEENEVVEVETPTKKMKYLQLGSQDKPISFDSDDE